MEQREDGKIAMTKVILRPETRYFGDAQPSRELLEKLYHRAHELCLLPIRSMRKLSQRSLLD